jgi:hypothetical protein
MNIDDEEIRAVVRDSAANATEVLAFITSQTDSPMLAMTSLMLSSAVFARSIGMAREAFLEGTAAAFNSLEEATPYATH